VCLGVCVCVNGKGEVGREWFLPSGNKNECVVCAAGREEEESDSDSLSL